ncbi:MAG TPA: hypothetical protein VKQ72_07105, partial [Aggregatilineales bacterium]|nr:hypothetical protein [Aggregatilineales bacterium]
IQAVQAPDGIHLSVNTGCRRLIEVGPGDPALDESEAARLLANMQAIVTLGDEVLLMPDRVISYEELLAWQEALIACLCDSDEDIWERLGNAARLLLKIEGDTPLPPDPSWQSLYSDLARLLTGLLSQQHSLEGLAARSHLWLPALTRPDARLGGENLAEGSDAFLAWIARQYLEGQQVALHRTVRSGWVALLAAMVAALLGTPEIVARGDIRPDHALNSVVSDALDLFFNPIGQLALTEPNQQALLLALAEVPKIAH